MGQILHGSAKTTHAVRAAIQRSKATIVQLSEQYDLNPKTVMKVIGNGERQLTGRWLNNRAENSHQPFRRRERAMAKFRSAKALQKFASIQSSLHNHFNQERHLYNRRTFKPNRPGADLRRKLVRRLAHNGSTF